MPEAPNPSAQRFSPGFRVSVFDAVILFTGIVGSIILGASIWWAGMCIAWAVVHFFLFCNVFRISRKSELIWALIFILLSIASIQTAIPGWVGTFAITTGTAIFLIWRETKHPNYHGIFWKRWNPGLAEHWAAESTAVSEE